MSNPILSTRTRQKIRTILELTQDYRDTKQSDHICLLTTELREEGISQPEANGILRRLEQDEQIIKSFHWNDDPRNTREMWDSFTNHLPESAVFDVVPEKFEKYWKKHIFGNTKALIYYNKETGVGNANDYEFKFKENQDGFKLFPVMYDSINTSISREEVVKILEFSGFGNNPINEAAKSMRRATGLTSSQIVMNNGSLTLLGNKLAEPPVP